MAKPELMAAIREQDLRSVSAVFAALAPGGVDDAKSKMGLTSLLKMLWGHDFVPEKDGEFINDRVHANIQRDGTFSVVPQMKGGVTTPAQLRKIADVAEKYEVPMVKITGGQRIDLLGVRKEDLPAMWDDLGMPSGYAYGKSMRTVKTCVGSDFCRFGLGDSTQLGIDLETRFQGIESPAKMKMAVVGCPRNCAEAYVKDVGVVAVGNGKWEVYVGGAAGASVRKGDLLATVDSPEAVLRADRPVPAVLPGERQLAGAHLRLRAPRRAGADQGGAARGQRGHRRRPRRRHAALDRRLHRPVGPGRQAAGHPRPVPPVAAPDRPPEGARPMSLTDLSRPAATDHRSPGRRRTPSALVEDVPPGEGRAFVAGGTQVAVFRLRDGSLHATQAACPHAGGPLADGQTDVNVLVCPLHQYAFRWSDGASTGGAPPVRHVPGPRAGRLPRRRRLTRTFGTESRRSGSRSVGGRARTCMRSPCGPNSVSTSAGSGNGLVRACGTRVSNSTTSPAASTKSRAPSSRRSRPDRT